MLLPYSREIYFASMAAYNAAWLPAVLLAGLLAIPAAALAFYPRPHAANGASRFIAGYLAATWLWIGAAHQLGMMAELNFMAPLYGIAWLGQGVLLAWAGLYHGTIRFGFTPGLPGAIGKALTLFGLVIYPVILLALGHDWRSLPVVGAAPNPTAIFTVGLLLATGNRPPLLLFVVPLAWAGVAGVSAYLLDHTVDYAVSIAIVVALSLAILGRLKPTATLRS
ncbi:MAG: DUF6064 family protein [Proteobacteria bacterium]|nr:DUF6064 family protein [Pseudomonadota bacterium]